MRALRFGVLVFVWHVLAGSASAATLWGLTAGNTLVRFSSTTPGTLQATLPITGLPAGTQITTIEAGGALVGVASDLRRFAIDRTTGAATALPAQSPLPPFTGTAFGAARGILISETGSLVTFDSVAYTVWQPPAPAGHIVGLAWRQFEEPRLVALDSATDAIYRLEMGVGTPTLTAIGALGVDTSDEVGLDYGPRDGVLYAALTVAATPRLYTINPATGLATLVGAIPSGPIVSLAVDSQAMTLTRTSPAPVLNTGTELVETDATWTFTVRRVGSLEPASFTVHTTTPGSGFASADEGTDFVGVNQVLAFAEGEVEKTVTLTLREDTSPEPTESLRLTVYEPHPGQLGAIDSFYILIRDDDNRPPVLTMVSPLGPSTSVSSATVTLTGVIDDEQTGVTARLFPGTIPYIPRATTTGTPFSFPDVALQPGANHFSIEAVDVNGATHTRSFTITREAGTDHSYVLAEGATGSFFSTDVVLANPNAIDVPVAIDFLRGDGAIVPHTVTVPAQQRTTLAVDAIPGLEAAAMAAVVTADDYPLVVERTMRWDANGYGASTEKAASALSRTWYFAEGSQGFFSTFLLLVNPQTTSNAVSVRFLRESGGPVTKSYTMAPRQRLTIDAGAVPDLVGRSFGIEVTFTDPGMAERSMYFGLGAPWDAGHESAGAPAPATQWYLAEGATGPWFETFILVANPSSTPADVTLTFLPEGAAPITKTRQVPANGRLTVNIEAEDAALANLSAIGTRVTSSVPIVVERSQYWPFSPAQWYEAHNSFGQTETGTHWGLAEGRVGGDAGYKTYLMLTNHDTGTAAQVAVKFLREGGTPVVKSFAIAPASRLTIDVGGAQVPEVVAGAFGTEIVSSLPISVERAVYSNANGQFWAAGTIAAATRLP
jgi:hypothetical protein